MAIKLISIGVLIVFAKIAAVILDVNQTVIDFVTSLLCFLCTIYLAIKMKYIKVSSHYRISILCIYNFVFVIVMGSNILFNFGIGTTEYYIAYAITSFTYIFASGKNSK